MANQDPDVDLMITDDQTIESMGGFGLESMMP